MNSDEWVARTEREPEGNSVVWAYLPDLRIPKKMYIRGGPSSTNCEECDGQWKEMGLQGDEFTHWMPVAEPSVDPFGDPFHDH